MAKGKDTPMPRRMSVEQLRAYRERRGLKTPADVAEHLRRQINSAERGGEFSRGFLAADDPKVQNRREEHGSFLPTDDDEPRELTELFPR